MIGTTFHTSKTLLFLVWLFAHGITIAAVAVSNHNNSTIPSKAIAYDVHGKRVEIPLVGAGTWQYNDTIAYESLCKAFGVGYTFVDTAWGYHNQKGVGKAIRDCFLNTRKRSDLFVMTKVPGGLSRFETTKAHYENLRELGLSYVDHLMLHFPSDWDQEHASPELRQEAWRALEEMWYSGKARSIGISHYCPQHIQDIIDIAQVHPSVIQVEYHIGSGDIDGVMEVCKKNKILFMSFSPLCGPCQYDPKDSLISGDLVTSIGIKYNVSGSQVALRFIVQQALANQSFVGPVIPKSNSVTHLKANMDLFSFELDNDDMQKLSNASRPSAEAGDCEVP